MLKEFAQYLVSLKDNKLYEVGGEVYSDHPLTLIDPPVDRPDAIPVTGLDSIVKLIRAEIDVFDNLPIFARVDGPQRVSVFTTYDDRMVRDSLYTASCDVPGFREGFREYDTAIIELRSRFAENEGSAYLLDLLSRISREGSVISDDNGVSQMVEARKGIQLKETVQVRPRVPLCPYRTFPEIVQPASEFLVRLDEEGNVGLFEADGGMWKLEAKQRIAAYLEDALKDLVEAGKVVVMI